MSDFTKYSGQLIRLAKKCLINFFKVCQKAAPQLTSVDKERLTLYRNLYHRGLERDDKDARKTVTTHLSVFNTLFQSMNSDGALAEFAEDYDSSTDWIADGDYDIVYLTSGKPVEKTRTNLSRIFSALLSEDDQYDFIHWLFQIFSCLPLNDEMDILVQNVIERYSPEDSEPDGDRAGDNNDNPILPMIDGFLKIISDPRTASAIKQGLSQAKSNPDIANALEHMRDLPVVQQTIGLGAPGETPAPGIPIMPSKD